MINDLEALSTSVIVFPAIDTVTAGADFVACCRIARARNSLPAKPDFLVDSLLVHAIVGVLSEKHSILLWKSITKYSKTMYCIK